MTTLIKAKPPKLNIRSGKIDMTHGSGGLAMQRLIDQLFLHYFENPLLAKKNDAALIQGQACMAMTTDAHVIHPLFFPGGNIGSLAIHGTVNDLAMQGAMPHYMAASFILEEGLPLNQLEKIVVSMAEAARDANVQIVCGDTKVVERGAGDGVYITTTGVGFVKEGIDLKEPFCPGDQVILSGTMGDHGVAVMAAREYLQFKTQIQSDSASLHTLVDKMLTAAPTIKALRDPTRGGVATTLNEWASAKGIGFLVDENALPIHESVASLCELLGLDPLYVANEGKCLCVCPKGVTQTVLEVMHRHHLGKDARVIGEVIPNQNGFVILETAFGGQRVVEWLTGEQLPRIC